MTYQLTERTWPSLILSPITVDNHIIIVSSTLGIKVKQTITLSKIGLDPKDFEVKRVLDSTTIMVGPVGKNISKISEAIDYNGGTLSIQEQSRNKLGDTPILRAVYDEEPTLAIRTILVDPFGDYVNLNQSADVGLGDLLIFANNSGFIDGETYDSIEKVTDIDGNQVLIYRLGGVIQFQLIFEIDGNGNFKVTKSDVPVLLLEDGDYLLTESGDRIVL